MYINITKIFSLVDLILNNVGIKSYAIMKFERQITRGFAAASSSRDSIYVEALRLIQKSPILGNTMSLDEEGGNYVHNVFLQVGQDLGVIALFVLVIFIVYALVQIGSKKKSVENRLIILALFSISIGRLMFSSTIWRRPEFWMLVCFVLNLKRNQENKSIRYWDIKESEELRSIKCQID